MFGNDDNTQSDQTASDSSGIAPAFPASAPTTEPEDNGGFPSAMSLPSVPDDSTPAPVDSSQSSVSSIDENADASSDSVDEPAEAADSPEPSTQGVEGSTPAVSSDDNDGLMDIKKSALAQLSPLVGHLDQTPEEKFKTTMMMIQAADDKSLIKVAYSAAQAIEDEKVKAQALLDIINEINYFSQQDDK